MRKIKVKFGMSSPDNLYSGSAPNFSWLSKPVGGVWNQANGWYTCRESFASDIRRFVRTVRAKLDTNWGEKRPHLDLNRMRFAIAFRNGSKDSSQIKFEEDAIKRGLRIVRMMERRMGWVQSQVYRCANDTALKNRRLNIFVISASGKWMRTSQLISLYLLCLRIGMSRDSANLKSLRSIHKFALGMKQAGAMNGDIAYFRRATKYLLPILDNVDKLFFWQPTAKFWETQSGSQGIDALVTGGGGPELKKKFESLVKKG